MTQPTYIIGAYGYTAQLVAAKMAKANLEFIAVGRDQSKLAQVQQRFANCVGLIVADCQHAAEIDFVAKGALVVNCAGPFNLFALELISRCVAVGAHYIDITGEQEIVRHSYEHHAALALQNEVCVVHSMAFESALTDLLISSALLKTNRQAVTAVNSYYKLGSQQMSPGTKLTMKLANFAPNYIVEDQRLQPLLQQVAEVPQNLPFDAARIVPYPEVIFAFERFKPQRAASHFVLEPDSNLAFAGNFAKMGTNNSAQQEAIVQRFKNMQHVGPDAAARSAQDFELYVSLFCADKNYVEAIRGHNMYEITAALVVLAVQHFAAQPTHFGVLSPGQFLGQKGLDWLSKNPYFQFISPKSN
jgi:short subunit dehydrogenase-like uncharacterized protein